MEQYLLAHDLGTSGNKATLYSTSGKLVKSMVHAYPAHFYNATWAEQNPDDWWEAVCTTTKELLRDIDPTKVAAISFSGQMMGCLCVDRQGNPLRSALIWADQRAVKQADELGEKIDPLTFYHITGHRNSPSYSIQKFMWIKENQPEIYENTYKMLHCKDYIVLKLTGRFVSEYSDATSTVAFDLNKLEWSQQIVEAAGIDPDKLPELVPSTTVVGYVTEKAAIETGMAPGTPVVIGGGDGVCAAVGAGCIKENKAYNYVGSSSWVAITTEKPIFDDEMRTFNWAHMVPGMISPCGTMQAAGASYNWLKNELCGLECLEAKKQNISPYKLIDREIEQSPPGANGLLYLPYLLGERSPRWNPNARGAFIGLKMEHQKRDIYRAVLEGVTMNLNCILSVFKRHAKIDEVTIIGGGAKGMVWLQMLADIYNTPVLRPNYLEEATSMGATIAAGVGAGVFKDFDVIDRFLAIDSVIQPDPQRVAIYDRIKPVFDASYFALTDVYDQLAKL